MLCQEQVFADICAELGCPMDNEAVLEAIAALKKRAGLGLNDKPLDAASHEPPATESNTPEGR